MKKLRRFIVFMVVIATFLCNSVFSVSASQRDGDSAAGTYALPSDRFYLIDESGNGYSARTFSSLNEAKSYYGWDFSYDSCNVNYGGNHYNYFYCFSNGTKLFFYVGM